MKCIVVEDDPFWAAEISHAFDSEDVEILPAANGLEGLKLASENPDASMILDLVLPDIDGIEVLSRLRKLRPTTSVLAVTGGGRMGPDFYLKLARAHGAALGLAKPFTSTQLIDGWRRVTACDVARR